MRTLLSTLCFIAIWFLSAKHSFAQVIINEVYPAPAEGSEWVELYNSGSQPVSLSGWNLKDQLSTSSVIFSFTTQSLAAQTYLVVELATAKLNNSADGVTLLNDTGNVVDEMTYTSALTNMSFARISDTVGQFMIVEPTKNSANAIPPSPNSSPTTSPAPSPSPNPAISPQPSPSPTDWWSMIKIQEVMACPSSGQSESITLLNTDTQAHDLENWKATDASGQSKAITITILAHQSAVISWTSAFLNNSGDSLELFTPNGSLIDQMSYEECETGHSLIKVNGAWTTSSSAPQGSPSPTPAIATPAASTVVKSLSSSPTKNTPLLPSLASNLLANVAYNYLPSDIILTHSSSAHLLPSVSTPTSATTFTSYHPTNIIALTSVILGGALLVLSGCWGIYETFIPLFIHLPTTSVVGTVDLLPLIPK